MFLLLLLRLSAAAHFECPITTGERRCLACSAQVRGEKWEFLSLLAQSAECGSYSQRVLWQTGGIEERAVGGDGRGLKSPFQDVLKTMGL